eukprot:6586836-Pyramimonas_sp.AAC.1
MLLWSAVLVSPCWTLPVLARPGLTRLETRKGSADFCPCGPLMGVLFAPPGARLGAAWQKLWAVLSRAGGVRAVPELFLGSPVAVLGL